MDFDDSKIFTTTLDLHSQIIYNNYSEMKKADKLE